jgi:predicted alpha/beta superfamily hydrolase
MMPFPQGPRQVVYVLDANLLFGTAVEMTRLMSQLYGELPPLLIVGIAYNTDSPALQAELRSRDFTPTTDSGWEAITPAMPRAPAPTLPEDKRLGRSAEFLDFLVEEAKPYVEEKYDIASKGRTLIGSSLGGLFTLYAFLEKPGEFDSYIAISPSLAWGNGVLLNRVKEITTLVNDLDAAVFLAVGAEEEPDNNPMLAQFRMVSSLLEFADQLRTRNFPSLKLDTFVAEGETHTTVIPVAMTRGLRFIYPPLRPAWMP